MFWTYYTQIKGFSEVICLFLHACNNFGIRNHIIKYRDLGLLGPKSDNFCSFPSKLNLKKHCTDNCIFDSHYIV